LYGWKSLGFGIKQINWTQMVLASLTVQKYDLFSSSGMSTGEAFEKLTIEEKVMYEACLRYSLSA
jgi:hypothetical protein